MIDAKNFFEWDTPLAHSSKIHAVSALGEIASTINRMIDLVSNPSDEVSSPKNMCDQNTILSQLGAESHGKCDHGDENYFSRAYAILHCEFESDNSQ